MKNSKLFYSVGALLYCPANNEGIASNIVNEKFGDKFSLALCLEDTINDDHVKEAENTLISSLQNIYYSSKIQNFFIPKIFIRVRNSDQISDLCQRLGNSRSIISGFIIPKFELASANKYINEIKNVNSLYPETFYMMPIFESPSIINGLERFKILYSLKEQLDSIEPYVLNIRVGGNDLCHAFGFRRHNNETIYEIAPIANILSDIVTVFGGDYVVSGPVWEYFSGPNWKFGMEAEIKKDLLFGFIGKTVIHPNQIAVVNEALKVSKLDFDDAKEILNWDMNSASLVSGNFDHQRMNEYKTHYNWAAKIMMLAQEYGVTDNSTTNSKEKILLKN